MVSDANMISLAVWDAAVPVVAGGTFAIKVGAKAADGRALTGREVVVCDSNGTTVAAGPLGAAPWPGTESLYWVELNIPAPAAPQIAAYRVRLAAASGVAAALETEFSVVAATKPAHSVAVTVKDRDTAAPLADVEVRLGPFGARTDAQGRAALRACKGEFHVRLWRTGYLAAPQPLAVAGDSRLDLTMQHVPEEHPDARWVR